MAWGVGESQSLLRFLSLPLWTQVLLESVGGSVPGTTTAPVRQTKLIVLAVDQPLSPARTSHASSLNRRRFSQGDGDDNSAAASDGAATAAYVCAAIVTGICLCNFCSCHEILRERRLQPQAS
eukprot:COSAG01_NODE_3045_length_6671_cov_14.931396_8_plen_123_part_00